MSDKITKKLFMSATPKVYEIKKEDDVIEHSIDNYKNIFGEIFYSYDFKKAINNKYINDYQLIVPNNENEKNKYNFIYSNMLYHGYKKCLIYCKNIEEAKNFEKEILTINETKYNFKIFVNTMTYKTSLKKRNKILNEFIKDEYKLSFVISVHTLDECIDIPKCDSVYITYNVKNSINIIQRISRCLRTYQNKIKSGIFIWCTNLVKINDIMKNYDSDLINKIYIKNNIFKEKDVVKNSIYMNINNNINDLCNEILVYDKNNISFIIDTTNTIWFKLLDITNILQYKSRKDVIRNIIDKKYRKSLRNIESIYKVNRQQENTVYLNINGLCTLIIKSNMKNSENFKTWFIDNTLPRLIKIGFYNE